MGRKSIQSECEVCGGQARKINYVTKSKGKTYHYTRFVHPDGTSHFFKKDVVTGSDSRLNPISNNSIADSLQEIVYKRMNGKEFGFKDIKSMLENVYGRPIGPTTIHRNIKKLLKLDLINRRTEGSSYYYSRKTEDPSAQDTKVSTMSVAFDFTKEVPSVAVFAHVVNSGLKIVTGMPLPLPVGVVDSPDQINLIAFDETGSIPLSKENIVYSFAGQTGLTITLNKPLHKMDEKNLFLNYRYQFDKDPIKLLISSNVDFLKIYCVVQRGTDAEVKKRMMDGFKVIDPLIVKRTGSESGTVTVSAVFEKVSRGDTIVISVGR